MEIGFTEERSRTCCARHVAGTGIQLHGGIGMTWEHDQQLYFKRATALEVAFVGAV
jgi:alkylation response protein AidB-like acyl-CoA dehydrogenase